MLTEEQAREKWCPAVRYPGGQGDGYVAANRDYDDKSGYACIASDCMWWRWEMMIQADQHHPATEWPKVPTGRGYCGIAGKP